MISKPKGARLNRWAAGALVIGSTTAVLAAPFAAGTALAAAATIPASSVTINTADQNQNVAAGNTITIHGTYAPTNSNAVIMYTVLGGPDTSSPNLSGTACTTNGAGAYTCTLANNGTAGTDTVRVFADNNGDGNYTAGEPFQDTSETFSGPPFSISLTPDTANSTTGTCVTYTATATDSGGRPSAEATINLSASETVPLGNTTDPAFCTVSNGSTITNGGDSAGPVPPKNPAVSNANATTQTNTRTGTATTDSTGTVKFGIQSGVPGTVTVKATSGSATDTSTQTVTAGGANAVTQVLVSPATANNYTNQNAIFTVTLKDASGNPIQGVPVVFRVDTGPDAATYTNSSPGSCGNPPNPATLTDANGQITCLVHNGGVGGTDKVTFWVNNTTSTPRTAGLDPGEPSGTADANFTVQPTVTSIVVTCTTPGATAGSQNCTVPVDQKSVTFTAVVKNAGTAVSGAVVTWTNGVTGGPATADFSPSTATCTTDATGTCTETVSEPAPKAGEVITATAMVGSQSGAGGTNVSTATYAARAPQTFTLTPALQTVTKGGTVTLTAKVVDQFGGGIASQSITYTIAGRNAGKTGTVTTGSDGTATISYTDTAVNSAATSDTVTATDTSANAPAGNTQQATVNYISGSTTASSITVDTSGNCTFASGSNSNAGPAGPPPGNPQGGTGIQVCALVKNADGTILQGKSVTFSVDKGFVSKDALAPGNANFAGASSVTVTTDSSGIAHAFSTSKTSGTQTVTATSDSATGTGTINYAASAATGAYSITLTPPTANIVPGNSQKFTATVKDVNGNGVPNVSVTFTQTGPGTFSAASSVTATTDATGVASATLTTTTSDKNSGSVTATIATAATACNSNTTATTNPSNCSATSTYTLGNGSAPVIGSFTNNNPAACGSFTISGTAPNGATVTLSGFNFRQGTFTIGTATANGSGAWTFTGSGICFNTTVTATTGSGSSASNSNTVKLGFHQVFTNVHFTRVGPYRKGLIEYNVSGSSTSIVGGEPIRVQNGACRSSLCGITHMRSNGFDRLHIYLLPGTYTFVLYGTGGSDSAFGGDGHQYLNAGRTNFTVHIS